MFTLFSSSRKGLKVSNFLSKTEVIFSHRPPDISVTYSVTHAKQASPLCDELDLTTLEYEVLFF